MARYGGDQVAVLRIEDCINQTCPWSGDPVDPGSLTLWNGKVVGFCNPGCRDKFTAAQSHFEDSQAAHGVSLAD